MAPSETREKAGSRIPPKEENIRSQGLQPSEPIQAKILLVDDHPANLLALEAILEPLAQPLVKAGSGEEALKCLLNEDYSVILLDVQMPGLDGLQTARIIKERKRSAHIPIIFLTALSKDSSHVFRGYAHGAVDYLLKPFDPDILRSKVSVFVDLFVRREQITRDEAALREREREQIERSRELRYRNLTDALPLCVWATNPAGKVIFCNRVWREFSGLTLEETIERGIASVLHPDDATAMMEAQRASTGAASAFEMEYRLRRASDGTYRWMLIRSVPDCDEEGRVVGWLTTAVDINENKNDRDALAQFKSTLDATLDAVFIFGPTLRLTYVNQGASAQLGYSSEEFSTMTALDLEPSADEASFRAVVAGLISGKLASHGYRAQFRHKSGRVIPVEIMLQYIVHGGSEGRFVQVVRDITRQQDIESALRRANEAKDSFLAAASHELRTPLAAAKAQAQLALRKLRHDHDDNGPGRALGVIGKQIDRMAKLVEDLLDVSRLQVGRLSLELTLFDLAALVRETCERVQVLSAQHSIETRLQPITLTADRGRIDQVLTNLMTNAIRYSPGGGVILVEIVPEEDNVHLRVIDHGVGIPKDKQETIFERFGRAHGSKYGGLGLGLTIAHGIVRQHGGEIWVESSGVPGRGSTFHVRLPLAPTESALTLVPMSPDSSIDRAEPGGS